MAKSNYLPGILFGAALLFCSSADGVRVRESFQLSALSSQNRVVSKVRSIYNSQIGVREQQSNAGPQVEKYLQYVNLPKGNPWCAAFVCWVYGQAGVSNPRTGWSPWLFPAERVIWGKAQSQKLEAQSSKLKAGSPDRHAYPPSQVTSLLAGRQSNRQQVTPASGDIFSIYFPEKKRIAHVGFIDAWDGTWLTTVEGNTNIAGDRDGDGVYRKRRLVRSIYKVARYIN